MATEAYVLDDYSTLSLQTTGAVSTPIAGIQGVTITPNVSIERLYTADSIKIEEQQQFEFQCDVSIEYALWDSDATLLKQWLGGEGSSSTSITDTTDPEKFQVDGTFASVNTNRTLSATVTGITFEEMPVIDTEMGEFVSRDISGVGENIKNVNTAIP